MEEKDIKFTLKGDKWSSWPLKVKLVNPQGKVVDSKKFLDGGVEYTVAQTGLSWKEVQEQLGKEIVKHNADELQKKAETKK